MSTISETTKQELLPNSHNIPLSLSSSQSHHGHTSRNSKPQACKVCGKMLSSASSYYVHLKLHSGTKPFQCTVSFEIERFYVRNRCTYIFEIFTVGPLAFVVRLCSPWLIRKLRTYFSPNRSVKLHFVENHILRCTCEFIQVIFQKANVKFQIFSHGIYFEK
jgi:hypothetical protein